MSPSPNGLLIDVRTPGEFSTGALANDLHTAINIEYQDIALLAEQNVSKTDHITLYCRSGRRSRIALQTLHGLGYMNARDIGGLEEAQEVLKREELGRLVGTNEEEKVRRERGNMQGDSRKKAFGMLLDGLRKCE